MRKTCTVKDMLAVLKQKNGGDLYMRTRRTTSASWETDVHVGTLCSVSSSFHKGAKQTSEIDCLVRVIAGHRNALDKYGAYASEDNTYEPSNGHWSLSGFERERLINLLTMLPKSANVEFEVHLDHFSTIALARVSIHADALFLVATVTDRGGKAKRLSFLVDASSGEHNSARFGNAEHAPKRGSWAERDWKDADTVTAN